jgi:TonB family protein
MSRHTYKPPTGKSGTSLAVLGGLLATLAVFVVIPLSQKLNDIFQPPAAVPDDTIAVDPPEFENTDLNEPPPEPEPEEKVEEMVEEASDLDLGFDAADLAVGGGGAMLMDVPRFGVKDAANSMMEDQMDTPPQPTTKFPPQYPSSLLQKKITGKVIVACVVDASGKISGTSIRQSSGQRELDQAALTAVSRWKFKPAQKAGKPVKGSVLVPFNFEIK